MITSPSKLSPAQAEHEETSVVDDLLRGANDWRSVQDIVRLTIKALSEVVKIQASAIKELEKQVSNKVSKNEAQGLIAAKADRVSVFEQFNELKTQIDNRSSLLELQARIDEKVSFNELSYQLGSRASVEELNAVKESCTSVRDLQGAVQDFYVRIERVQGDLAGLSKTSAPLKELESLAGDVRKRPSIDKIESLLRVSEEKVANLLKTRPSRAEVEESLSRKAENSTVQNIAATLGNKAEQTFAESLGRGLSEKVDKEELERVYLPGKVGRRELEEINGEMREFKLKTQEEVNELFRDVQVKMTRLSNSVEKALMETNRLSIAKAETSELEKTFAILNKKADKEALEGLLQSHQQETLADFSERYLELRQLTEKQENSVAKKLLGLQTSLNDFSKELSSTSLAVTANSNELESLTRTTSSSQHALSTLTDQLSYHSSTLPELKSAQGKLADLFTQLTTELDSKADISEVGRIIESSSAHFLDSIRQLESLVNNKIGALDSEFASISANTVTTRQLSNSLSDKADLSQVNRLLNSRASCEELLTAQTDIQDLYEFLKLYTPREEFQKHSEFTQLALEDLSKDLLLKANVKEICALLDSKANVGDINGSLSDIHKELDEKAGRAEFAEHAAEQGLINELVCSENTVGRWIWKNGELKPGCTVPWDIQTVNTCPDNFLWEPEAPGILVTTPGLYEIIFGFYAKRKPKVQLLVNGEPVLSAVNSASYVIHHSSGRLLNVGQHTGGNITGLTLIDFLALPPKAKVSLCYNGEYRAEGFMGLRKL